MKPIPATGSIFITQRLFPVGVFGPSLTIPTPPLQPVTVSLLRNHNPDISGPNLHYLECYHGDQNTEQMMGGRAGPVGDWR